LTTVVAATTTLGLLLAASAAESKKEKAAKPEAKTEQAAKASNSTQIAAPLTAKVSSKLIVNHKLTPKTFVSFKLADLAPNSGQAPAATAMLTLKNGKQVEAQKYLTSINALEKKLNAWGYSLRGPAEKVVISELDFGKEKLTEEAKVKLPLVKGDARAQSLLTSPKVLEQEHAAAVKALKPAAKTTAKTTAKESAKASKTANAVVRGPGVGNGATGVGVLRGFKPFTFTKSFDEKIGSTSTFGADVNTSLTFKDDGSSATLNAVGRATGSVLGITKDLVVATVDLAAPQTGNLTANVKVTVLGDDIVVLNESQAASYSKNGTFSRSLPNSLQVQVNVPVGPFSVVLIAGVQGSISMPYFVGLTPLSAQGWMIPKVTSSVYAQAAFGLDVDDTGVIAGVEVNLTLLNNNLILAGGASQGADSTGTFVNYWVVSEDTLTALSGKLSVFVAAEAWGIEEKLFSTPLFNFGGVITVFTPVSGGGKVYLAQSGPVNADVKAEAKAKAKSAVKTSAKKKS
jgi:hypothetical protein